MYPNQLSELAPCTTAFLKKDNHNPCFDLVATTDSYNKEASRTFPLNEVGKAAAIRAAVGFGGNDLVPKAGGGSRLEATVACGSASPTRIAR